MYSHDEYWESAVIKEQCPSALLIPFIKKGLKELNYQCKWYT